MTQKHKVLEVLFFLPQLGGGGAEMNAVRLAPGLIAAGIRPIYAVARGPGSYGELLPKGAQEIILETGRINSSNLRLLRASKKLRRLIEEREPAILCPVMVTPALVALRAIQKLKKPPVTILSIQNSLSVSHELQASLLSRIELSLIKRDFPALDGVIALSEGVADELKRIVPSLKDRVTVIPNVGYPLPSQLTSVNLIGKDPKDSSIVIVACGRLTKQKDYPTLLRAFCRLKAGKVRLDILGEGEERARLLDLSRELGIADRVRFHGFQRDPFSYMRTADIFVLSSQWEGFGNVIVEAMAMGTPVVATNCPHGPAEIIETEINGLLVPPGQPVALADAIQRLVDDADLRKRLGQAGRKRSEDFTAEKIGSSYADAFRSIALSAGER